MTTSADMTTANVTSVLQVEDSPTDALLTREEIERYPHFRLTQVDRLEAALGVLATGNYAVVLLDLGLPDSQGLETLIRFHKEAPEVPVVVMTARDDEELALRAVQAGAQDYLVKGQTREFLLERTLRYAIERNLTKQTLRERGAFASLNADVCQAFTRDDSLREMLQQCVASMIENLGGAFARVWTFNPLDNVLELQASAGMYTHTDGPHSRVPMGQLMIGRIAEERKPYLTNDLAHEQRLSDPDWAKRERMIAFAGYPLLMENRLVGVMALFTRKLLSETSFQAMDAVANQIALGIERRRGEESLKLFRTLLDHSNDAIEVIDPVSGRILDMNQTGCESLGYSLDEILRLGIADVDPRIAERGWAKASETVRQTGSFFSETQHRRKDGSILHVEVNAKMVQMDRDYIVAVVRDITERKKSAEELRQSEERFHQAQKMEVVGQLAGGVAHDFNNLLTIISGYSEILLMKLLAGDPLRELVKAISEAGERAALLTRQLLAFSRKTVLEPKVLNLNEVVWETEKILRRLIGEDIVLSFVLDPAIGRVKVDPGQLGQVLMNLIVNARDAMPKGGKITVETLNVELGREFTRLRPEVQPGQFILLSVTDTGTGMTAEVKARIFEPFFTTKGVGKGTGLGLAVVQGIVKQSDGHVEVYSEPGVGTTFKVYFPAVEETLSPPSKKIVLGNGGRGTETILLVEDEDSVRTLAAFVLQTFGYTVKSAGNGKEALRILENQGEQIDLLLTDVVMPGMGGPDLAESLRPRFPRMKVLFSSGYTDDAVVRHGLLKGNAAFLRKPYTPLALARKVREVLDAPVTS